MNRRKRLKQRNNKIIIFRRIAIFLGIITAFTGLAAFSMLADAVKEIPKLENPQAARVDETTRVYAADKRLITSMHAEQNRLPVPLNQVPKNLRRAIVAIEDRRFWEHHGVDLEAVIRALFENLRSGKIVEGGSTLTQQYVRNVYISPERTLNRKIKEAVLAYELEKRYSKTKILEKYLNTVYFGHGNYGVQSASEAFFRKKVHRLSLAEAALLAGLIRSPQRYSPWGHKGRALARRNLVLSKMAEQKIINEDTAIKAKALPLGVTKQKPQRRYPGAYFVEFVRQQMLNDKRFGTTEQERAATLYKGGLRIYTTIDLETQRMADEAIKNILDRVGDPSASLVAVHPKTGYVKAISGGRDFFNPKVPYTKFNLATQSRRQTGSAFKVFVLTTAISQGITPSKTYDSSPATLPLPGGGTWRVDNYTEGRGYGQMSVAQGTIKSVNALYARLMLDVGAANVVKIAHKMGITSQLEPHPAIALGGLKKGVSPYEMASAMATLANNGTYVKPITILKITDSRGKVLLRNSPKPKQVIPPSVASTVTSVLRGVITRGTGTAANIGRPAAGKTGTAQNYRDAWFIGYTPDLAAAVWVGYPQGQIPMLSVHGMRVTGGSFPARIWAAFMREALMNVVPSNFPYSKWYSSGETRIQVCKCNGIEMLANEACPANTTYYRTVSKEELAKLKPCDVHKIEGSVPSVVGLSASKAAQKLNSAGFGVNKKYRNSSKSSGIVIDQSPSGGKKVKQGTTVTIYVSKGPEQTSVPSVIGMSEESAKSALSSAGFSNSVSYQDATAENVGLVISQSPHGGTKADKGSTVSIVVGKAPDE